LFSTRKLPTNPFSTERTKGGFLMRKIKGKIERYERRHQLTPINQKQSLMSQDMVDARKRLL
jgi:hypothetical protein